MEQNTVAEDIVEQKSPKFTLPANITPRQRKDINNVKSRSYRYYAARNQLGLDKAYNDGVAIVNNILGANIGPRIILPSATRPATIAPVSAHSDITSAVVKTEKILTLQRAIRDLGDSAEEVLLQCGYIKQTIVTH